MRTSKVILGLVAGVAAGAIIGVLLAPDSGDNTRKKIASKSQGMMDEMKTRFNSLVDSFASLKEEVRDNLNTMKNKASDGIHKAADNMQKAASDTVRKVTNQ